jgi:hypothetical protein
LRKVLILVSFQRRRRKADRIDERDMEEEGKDREEEGWEIGIEEGIFLELFGIVI